MVYQTTTPKTHPTEINVFRMMSQLTRSPEAFWTLFFVGLLLDLTYLQRPDYAVAGTMRYGLASKRNH